MVLVTAALVLLVMLAASVTVVDAVRAARWRVVAAERRHAWHERTQQPDVERVVSLRW